MELQAQSSEACAVLLAPGGESGTDHTEPALMVEWHQLALKYSHLRVDNPARRARLMTSLAQIDQQTPVSVVESEPNRFVLIDGYRRVEALRKLGRDGVRAVRLAMTETEALLFCHHSQRGPPHSAIEEAWLLFELTEIHGISQGQLAKRLGKSQSWVSRRLGLLTTLPDSVQQAVRKAVVCAHSAQKYLVAMARAKFEHCAQLVANLGNHRTTSREIERLYRAYKAGTKEEKEKLVANPLLFLKVDAERQRPDSEVLPETAAEVIVNDLEAAAGCCRRARKRLRQQQRQGEDMSMNEAVNRAYQELMSAQRALIKTWEEYSGA